MPSCTINGVHFRAAHGGCRHLRHVISGVMYKVGICLCVLVPGFEPAEVVVLSTNCAEVTELPNSKNAGMAMGTLLLQHSVEHWGW